MSLASDMRLLGTLPVFAGFEDDHLRLIAFSAESKELAKGKFLFKRGQPLNGGFVVTQGRLCVVRTNRLGADERRPLDAPATLAERALVAEARAPHSVVAETDCMLIQLRRATFARFLEEYPEMARVLLRRVAFNLVASARDLGAVRARLARLEA